MKSLLQILQLLRIKQWVKNTFIFFPLFFAGTLFEGNLLANCVQTFFGFCFTASGLYILNDFLDRERDRLHPKKAKRPLVEGNPRPLPVAILILVLLFLGLSLCNQVNDVVFMTAVVYIFIHLVYNFVTKKIVIMDVVFIAIGFQIRIWAGAAAAGVVPSVWLQMCVFLLALFLGFTKRRQEISTLKERAPEHRSVLEHYTAYLLDQMIIICSTLAIVFYGLYTLSFDIRHRIGSQNMIYSVAFVLYGIFRYLYLVHVHKKGDDAGEILLSDGPLLIDVLLWIVYIAVLLYFPV